jgi:hypothetical protein
MFPGPFLVHTFGFWHIMIVRSQYLLEHLPGLDISQLGLSDTSVIDRRTDGTYCIVHHRTPCVASVRLRSFHPTGSRYGVTAILLCIFILLVLALEG